MERGLVIGRRIREARKAHGYTQEALAELTGTSRRHIMRWERGDHVPGETYRGVLSDVLGLDFSDIEENEAEDELLALMQRIREIRARRSIGEIA